MIPLGAIRKAFTCQQGNKRAVHTSSSDRKPSWPYNDIDRPSLYSILLFVQRSEIPLSTFGDNAIWVNMLYCVRFYAVPASDRRRQPRTRQHVMDIDTFPRTSPTHAYAPAHSAKPILDSSLSIIIISLIWSWWSERKVEALGIEFDPFTRVTRVTPSILIRSINVLYFPGITRTKSFLMQAQTT